MLNFPFAKKHTSPALDNCDDNSPRVVSLNIVNSVFVLLLIIVTYCSVVTPKESNLVALSAVRVVGVTMIDVNVDFIEDVWLIPVVL